MNVDTDHRRFNTTGEFCKSMVEMMHLFDKMYGVSKMNLNKFIEFSHASRLTSYVLFFYFFVAVNPVGNSLTCC